MEHLESRVEMLKMQQAIDFWPRLNNQFKEAAGNYKDIVDQHIHKENNVLYPMAEQ